jgi:hypothetical protein
VHGDPFFYANTDRRDLPVLHPYPGLAFDSARIDPEPAQQIDKDCLYRPHIDMQIPAAFSKIQNEIANQLTRPMISRLAASIGLIDRVR